MEKEDYRLAGWAAIASALLFLPILGLLVYHDVQVHPTLGTGETHMELLGVIVSLDILSKIFGIYAILRFRDLLNQRYGFHSVDKLIPFLIFAGVAIGIYSYLMRVIEYDLAAIIIGATAGITFGIVGIVYSTRLLHLHGTLNGMLKPLAYTNLIGSVCFVTLVLAPLGLILFTVCNILLGIVFLGHDEEEVEFV